MEVKPGYKQTEVGLIPEEWYVKRWGDLFGFSGGYSASRDQLSSKGHCYLHYGDIHTSSRTFIDVRADYQRIPKLDIPLKRVASKAMLEDGDVVFVDASEDDAGTSKHVVVVNKNRTPFISGLHTIVAKSKSDELEHPYRLFCFQTTAVQRQFFFYAVGTKVSGISKTNIAKLYLPIPPLAEQRAIAEALSDADGLLGGLDRLIAKKRDLKQAAMQQLLTGQTRLPGFHGEWEKKRLAQVADLNRLNVVPANSPSELFAHFSLPAFDAGQIAPIELGAAIGSNKFRVPRDAVLVSKLNPRIPRIWTPASIPANAIASTEWLVLTPKGGTDRRFLHVLCSSPAFCEQMELGATGTTGSHQRISPGTALGIITAVPMEQAEQTAIAAVLTEMDLELAALEQRREKTRALKQAMMQELLTGRTRLVGRN